MSKSKLVLGLLVLGVVAYGPPAFAAKPNRSCVKGARQEKRDCSQACAEDFQISTDACRDVDHQCAEACRAAFHNCRQPLRDCIEGTDTVPGCNDLLRTNIAGCPPAGDPGRDSCVDGFQIGAFICRDNCREQFGAQVKDCKKARRSCVKNCPPPTPPPAP
jgi:hypothetical protein